MKKRKLLFSTVLFLILGIFLVSVGYFKEETNASKNVSDNFPSEQKRIEVEAKTDGFVDLNDLTEKSPIIVKGVRGEDIRTEVYTSKVNGSVNGGYTVGDFKITEVIKNEVDNVKINLENPIPVA
ncbi:hypothetical protein [Lysinibacillus parviboronicapiens]|uniref:hypothetical protein n=1 Tax=Lysinibacillus parviboronicapiens TaxID=436516 RepID=UPI000D342847|nr:hypothetical protein [Lysinibacillus parviboronicapiens]